MDTVQQEILDRVRRIETKVTRHIINNGEAVNNFKPEFDPETGELEVPSRRVSLQDCIDAIPTDWPEPVAVFIGEDHICNIDSQGEYQ